MPQPAVRRQRSRGAGTGSPRTKPRSMSWKEAVDQFLATKESENLSPATIENYAWHLGGPRARAFLADHQVSSPRQLTADVLRDLQRELLAAGVSPALAHAFHRVWKNFAGFCITHGYGADPAVLAVKAPKQPQVELHAEFGEEGDGGIEVVDDDADIIHALNRHVPEDIARGAPGLGSSRGRRGRGAHPVAEATIGRPVLSDALNTPDGDGPDHCARSGDAVQDAVAAVAEHQDHRRDRGGD